jgi:hypothetical protein
MREDELWRAEQMLWLDSVAFLKERVGPDALFVLPAAIVDRRACLAAARKVLPWSSVRLLNRRFMHLSEDTTVLAYEAQAVRSGCDIPYGAYCSSTYVRTRGSWSLIAHHRTERTEHAPCLTETGALNLFFAAPDAEFVEQS